MSAGMQMSPLLRFLLVGVCIMGKNHKRTFVGTHSKPAIPGTISIPCLDRILTHLKPMRACSLTQVGRLRRRASLGDRC